MKYYTFRYNLLKPLLMTWIINCEFVIEQLKKKIYIITNYPTYIIYSIYTYVLFYL